MSGTLIQTQKHPLDQTDHTQVRWHPQYTKGVRLEDFEMCECMFSSSNELARPTRLSTIFHRRQEILEHFNFQDQDKLRYSGDILINLPWFCSA
jgi:hypothetical protein